MKRKFFMAVVVLLTVLGAVAVVYYQDGGFSSLIGTMLLIFLAAVALGIIIRFIRAAPGERIREAFGPVMGAGDSYQSLLLGRPTGDESSSEAQSRARVNKANDDGKDEPRW